MAAREGELLAIALDCSADAWASTLGALVGEDEATKATGMLFQAVAGIASAHVAFAPQNRVAVIAFGPSWSEQAFPAPGASLGAPQAAALPHSAIMRVCRDRLGIDAGSSEPAQAASAESGGPAPPATAAAALAGAHGRGLASALSRAVLVCLRHARDAGGASRRILVVAPGTGVDGVYVPLLNAAFAARDASVAVDVVAAAPDEDTVFLQQVAHETGGAFAPLNATRARGPMEHLLATVAPSKSARAALAGPVRKSVDLRASCMLSGRRVSTAFVCFVCLAVFAEFHAECPVCHTKAPDPAPPAKRPPA